MTAFAEAWLPVQTYHFHSGTRALCVAIGSEGLVPLVNLACEVNADVTLACVRVISLEPWAGQKRTPPQGRFALVELATGRSQIVRREQLRTAVGREWVG